MSEFNDAIESVCIELIGTSTWEEKDTDNGTAWFCHHCGMCTYQYEIIKDVRSDFDRNLLLSHHKNCAVLEAKELLGLIRK